jgi:malonyl-CoA decarboxylase
LDWYLRTWDLKASGSNAAIPASAAISDGDAPSTAQASSATDGAVAQLLRVYMASNATRTGGSGGGGSSGSGEGLPIELVGALWHEWAGAKAPGAQLRALEQLEEAATMLEDPKALRFALNQLLADLNAKEGESATSKGSGETPPTAKDVLRRRRQLAAARRNVHSMCTPLAEQWLRCTVPLPGGTKRVFEFRHSLLKLQRLVEKSKAASAAAPANTTPATIADDASPKKGSGGKKASSPPPVPLVPAVTAAQEVALEVALDACTTVLREWCATSWLGVQELSWVTTPAAVIDQVVRHERVHPFSSFEDVRARMHPAPNRRVFAFFHPNVPREPLVMVQVALTRGIADSVDVILGRAHPLSAFSSRPVRLADALEGRCAAGVGLDAVASGHGTTPATTDGAADSGVDTAIFYTISATQPGLQGIELGKHLILAATRRIKAATSCVPSGRDVPAGSSAGGTLNSGRSQQEITEFSTLSPIPGFMIWLKQRIDAANATALATSNRGAALIEALLPAETPKDQVIAITATLGEAVATCVIPVLDHIIARASALRAL